MELDESAVRVEESEAPSLAPSSSSDLVRVDGIRLVLDVCVLDTGVRLKDVEMSEREVVSLGSRAAVWCGVVTRDGMSSLSESMVTMFSTGQCYATAGSDGLQRVQRNWEMDVVIREGQIAACQARLASYTTGTHSPHYGHACNCTQLYV